MISVRVLEDVLGHTVESVQRVAGGTRKGVYRLTMPGGGTKIAYSWADAESFWPHREDDGAHDAPFTAGTGLDLFRASCARSATLGLRSRESHRRVRDTASRYWRHKG